MISIELGVLLILVNTIFGGIYLLSGEIASRPRWQRIADGSVRKALYYPISCIVLATISGGELLFILSSYRGIVAWFLSLVLGASMLHFLNVGISWILEERRQAAFSKADAVAEEERLHTHNGS